MKRIISLGFILAVLMTSSVYCQGSEQPLQLLIKSDKEVYAAGEGIQIEALLRNVNNNTIKIYSPDYWGVTEIKIVDSQGSQLKPHGIKVERKAFEEFMVINPGEVKSHIYSNLRWFHRGGAWEFRGEAQLKPDTYQITVTITNPPVRFSEQKVLENTWSGTLTSNTITIEVGESERTDLPPSLSFLSDIPEFQEFRFQMSDSEIREIAKKSSLIFINDNQDGFLLMNQDGEIIALSMSNDRCSGIQRLRKSIISLLVKLDKEVYEIGEPISASTRIKNFSDKPIRLSDFYKPSSFSIQMKNEHNEKCVLSYIDVIRPIMPAELLPGEFVDLGTVEFTLPNNITKAENYIVLGKHSIYIVDSNLTSNIVTFDVVKK